ncbi:MAG TPA: LuxR C-terminal-related transcriptional regulator [Ilumatobacteraceae bacterium]|nr:LuxR C-terminal-related transcriptional regulator [Ilumatobacteraceae bacterium]
MVSEFHADLEHESPGGALLLGTTDERMVIDRVSPGSERLIGYSPAELLGQPIVNFVDEADVIDLLEAFEEASSSNDGASRAVAVSAKDGDAVSCEVVVVALVPAPSRAFAFIPEGAQLLPTTATAQQRLVQQLGGVLREPAPAQFGADLLGIGRLTRRELDIVTLLVAGDRVRSIAQRLFLSQSTVRSHLSVIFSKFGVRSQSELLDLLRARYRESTDRDRS